MITCLSLSTMKPAPFPSDAVICLGNFDGVHIAHRRLLRTARKISKESSTPLAPCVFCFLAPSSDFIMQKKVPHLSTQEQKLTAFFEEGMEYAILADFPSIRDLSPAEFATKILLQECHCRAVVCGFNYRFGKNGIGTPALLEKLLNIPVQVCEKVTYKGETVSSTYIRSLLARGQAEKAAELLTRPYSLSSKVIHGKALGKKMGTPTINQYFSDGMLIPRLGVYVTRCTINGKVFKGISNIGVHPTVDQNAPVNCETYLLDFSGDLYESEIQTEFLKFIRPEIKFDSLEALQARIQEDIDIAKKY